jgi:riboflavin synthase
MFTGLVQTQGQLQRRAAQGSGFVLSIRHDLGTLELGESIAVNGACLTVTSLSTDRFDADCSKETVERTNLGRIGLGASLHLERALRIGDRLGGHLVSGHIDAMISFVSSAPQGDSTELLFELPEPLAPYVAEKGSVALDGVSLTVSRLPKSQFAVTVIPHTLRSTHLGSLRRGDGVNLEVDMLSRYLVHAARVGRGSEELTAPRDPRSTVERDDTLRKALSRAGML